VVGALALLGTTFSPYAFFWQTEEEIEEHRGIRQVKQTGYGVALGFVWSNLLAFFIMIASASVILNANVNLLTVKDIAQALAPLAGGWASKLFGLGLVGSGILAIPVLASTSAYAVAEFFKWPLGLNKKPDRAKGFYGIITFGFILCLAVLVFNLNPIKIIFLSQILVGILTPLIIYFILRIASNKKIMGDWQCNFLSLALGWLTILILLATDAFLIYFLL
jgi:Mn2+/Fe2+ NRAMP family transporter